MLQKTFFLSVILIMYGFVSIYAQETTQAVESTSAAETKPEAAPIEETPKPKYWIFKTMTGLNIAQTAFRNWSAGGENSFAVNAVANLSAVYSKDRHNWENILQTEYGQMWTPTQKFNKTVDKLFVSSKYGYKIEKTEKKNVWLYSATIDFQTQYDKGYAAPDATEYLSTFMAPAYLNASVGITYMYKNIFTAYMSPLTSRTTFVLDTFLSNRTAFGIKNAGDKFLEEIGFSAKASVNATLAKNVTVQSALTLFTPYDKDFGNFVVDWNVLFLLKVNSFLSATVGANLKYDDKVDAMDAKGNNIGPKVQFQEMITVGLVYAFDSTKPHKRKDKK